MSAPRPRRTHRQAPARAGRDWVWLFDLDNTLHDASHAIFPCINQGMNRYLMRHLGLDADAASAMRTHYWHRYGATLLGLVRHHGVDAQQFLRESHEFEDLAAIIRAENGLQHLFSRLPGRKVLLTNAPSHYSMAVLQHLRIAGHFSAAVSVEQMRVHGRYRPKPSVAMLEHVLAHLKLGARSMRRRVILVEDARENLAAARRCGLRTVLVEGISGRYLTGPRKRVGRSGYIDLKVESIRELPRRLRSLR